MGKNLKKALALFFAVIMLVSVVPVNASATYVTNTMVGKDRYGNMLRWNYGYYTGNVNSAGFPDDSTGTAVLNYTNDIPPYIYTLDPSDTGESSDVKGVKYVGGFSNGFCYGNGKRYYERGLVMDGTFYGSYSNAYYNTSDKVIWRGKLWYGESKYKSGYAYATSTTEHRFVWDKLNYYVKYDANGGKNAPAQQTKVQGTNLTLSSSKPSRDGYTFKNWNTKADGSGTSYNPSGTYSQNAAVTLYAQWDRITYTVSYNANGGTGAPSNQTKFHGSNLTLTTSKPSKDGYTFTKWNTKADGSGTSYASGGTYSANAKATLYAQWTINKYTIVYNANGGTGAPSNQTKTHGTNITLSSSKPTKTGSTFKSWNTKSNGTGTAYSPGATYSSNADLTLYAQWNVNNYNARFYSNGGVFDSGAITSKSVAYGSTITSDGISTPTKEGYDFLGWNRNQNATAASSLGVMDSVSGVNFYAVWSIKKYTIKYNANGGTGAPGNQTKTYGTDLTLSSTIPSKEDYVFIGWGKSTSDTTASYQPGDVYSGNAALTLYAIWVPDKYTITYDANGGTSAPDSQVKDYNVDLILSADIPERDNYSFAGWAESSDVSEATYQAEGTYTKNEDITLYAVWAPNEYEVKYNANGGTGAPDSQIKYYEQDLTLSTQVPVREGYTFLGWAPKTAFASGKKESSFFPGSYTSEYQSDLSTVYATPQYQPGDTYSNDASVTLYAVWQGEYYVYYDANGGLYPPSTQTFSEGDTIELSKSVPIYAKSSFLTSFSGDLVAPFLGWSESPDATVPTYQPGDLYSENRTITLYAVWGDIPNIEPGTYLVMYDANGGTDGPDYQIKYEGQSLIITDETPTRIGFIFKYWSTKKNPTTFLTGTKYYPGASYTKDKSITLYAQWEEVGIAQYCIETYYMDIYGDYRLTKTETDYYTVGKTVRVNIGDYNIPEGFCFNEARSVLSGLVAQGNTLVLQIFIDRNKHTISYDDGTNVFSNELYYEAPMFYCDPQEKEGYEFLGWSEDGETLSEIPETVPDRDIAYVAVWDVKQYSITFKYGDVNNDSIYQVITQDYGTAVINPDDPEFAGYTFLGWDSEIPETMPAQDITVNALWAVNEYRVYYVFDGKDHIDVMGTIVYIYDTFVYGETVVLRDKYEKEGYTVTDWELTPELEDGKMPACDVIAESYSYINTYTVTWNYDGESVTEDYEYGTEITEFVPPDKEGYSFNGWSPDVPETMPAQDLEFGAQYDVNSYKISYMVDGEFYDEKTYDYGADVIKLSTPEKDNYVFSGWDAEEPETMPAHDIELNGFWMPAIAEYTIETYIMNLSGEYDMTSEKLTGIIGHTHTAEYTVPEGFVFNEELSDLSGIVTADNSLVLKVYIDRNRHNISFNDGTSTTTDELYYDEEIVKPEDPIKEGYTFEGWSEDGETVVDIEETVPDRDIEYIAVWSINSYTITFNYGEVNDNAEYKTITKEFGKEIEEVADPEFTGYTFLGWNSQIPATMPSENLTITALWSVNEYKITYKLDGVEYFATPYESAVDIFTYGSEVTVRPNAVKEGYTVSDWEFTPALENGKMPASDAIANATSSANKYTLTVNYVMNDGSDAPEAHTEQVTYGEGYSVETPAVTGYTPDTELVEGTMDSTEGKTVTVTYDINSYDVNITYEISDDKADAPEAYSQTVEYGMDYSVESPDVPGYTPDVAVVEGKMGTEPINVTVIYTPNAHTVTWNVDGEKTIDELVYGDEIIKPTDPEKEGYTFEGWSEDGETVVDIEETVPDRDIEYIAVWSINSYTITYNVDGEKYDEKTYEYNADVAKLTAPVKQGYVFSGWDKEEPEKMPAENLVLNGSFSAATDTKYTVETYVMNLSGEYDKTSEEFTGTTGEPATAEYTVLEGFTLNAEKSELEGVIAPDESLTLKVYLDRNRHNISFNDGTDITSDELYYGADIVKPDDPKKEGYEFLGWSEDGETVVEVEETVPDRDIEYIAVWSVKQYTITFKYGEVNDNAEYKTITKEFGEEIEEIADPEFTGYTFLGWDSQIPATMPAENITITALWAVNEYKVTYKLDGVEYFATPYESAVDIFTYGSEVTVRPNAVKEGYTVSDWTFTPALENGKMPASDVTANATSAADIHTVTFTYGEVNGGAVYKEISAEYGTPVTAPENPEFSGFIFSGWDKNIPETIPAEDVTINAVWSQGTFTVTYKLDGEEYFTAPYESASDTVLYGEPVSVREKAVKEGYTVSDWVFTPALEDGKMPAGDVVANATSSVNSYTVTWIVNGSSTVDTYSFGAEIIRPEDPAMSGKVFKGWSGEIPATMPARNLVFVASFDAITHTATFVVPDKNGSYTDETGTYEVVKIVVFEEGQTAIAEPAVPEKDGFTGAWEHYTIGTTDIVIKAIYTIITTDNTGDIETDKTAEELGGGVVNITLNAYSDAQSILIDGENEPLDIILVVDQSGSMAYKMGKDENANVGQRRRDYLVNTATSFVNSVKQNAEETGADHRVSIVGFAMGNTSAQGYSKYENTEVLTTKNDSPVVYNKATSDVYRDSLMSVTDDYSHIMAAINNIDARGATAANLGFDMASKVLSENASDRKKVVIFLTDGEPTVTSDFDNGVANSAIINAKYLKAQGVTVYSIAISNKANPADETQDFNKFLNATSSNYPEASSVWRLSEGSKDNGYFVSVNDAEGLQKIFNNIYVRSVAKTLNFGAVTLYDTVRKEFIMTVPQEKAFRENTIEKYGITNSDITVDRRDDGTTYIEVRNLTPYPYYDSTNVMQGWKVDVSFDVSANESALNGGDYLTNTDEAGVIVGGYTVKTFVSPEATVENNRCIVEFIIGNDVYEIREMDMGEEIIAPECSYAHWTIPEGTKVSGRVAKYYANYGEADRTITWHIGDETVTQNYATGQKIVPPEVNEGDRQFVRWSPNVEAYMGYIDLEYTAVFSNHIHHYRQSKSVGLCDAGRTVTYTCSCGESYTEKTAACEHRLETTVYETDAATITHIFCTNCPFSEDKLLTFKTANTGSNGYWGYHNSTVASFDLYNDVDGGEIHNLDENQYIYIRVPKSSLSQSCRNALEQGKSINIIHYLADGGTEKCPYAVEEDYIVVKCTSFSYYVFTADELDESVSNAAFDCLFDGHQFKYVYNNDATSSKDGTETEVCEHCGATGETRTADGTKLNSEYKLPTSFKTQTAAYKTYVTVNVTLKDIPAGAKVYINGKEATASGNTYSADIGQVTATKEVKLEVKQGSTVLDSTTLKIEVNSSFFGKLISFFLNFLFNLFKWKKVMVSF